MDIQLIQTIGTEDSETWECESCEQLFDTIKCYKNTNAILFISNTKLIHIHVCDSETCLNIAILKNMS